MSPLLPQDLDDEQRWHAIHAQPLAYWRPALEAIRTRHSLPSGEWQRAAFGKTVVFTCGALVVKLCPPFWADDLRNEAAALEFVHARLPVATPELLAIGELDGWMYLVETRLPGELLRMRWPALLPLERVQIAHQHGALLAAVHALPIQAAPARLAFDWPALLRAQLAECAESMRQAGVPAPLLADLPGYLHAAAPLLAASGVNTLVHGDLDAVNMLVAPSADGWQISSLLDWGDVTLGAPLHDFISPAVHTYLGERAALRAWYAGYGWSNTQLSAQLEQELMTRALIYYGGEWARFLEQSGTSHHQRWAAVAAQFWGMRDDASCVIRDHGID